ncbi:hypothetical protein HOT49_gp192 [Erwinia phage vB_EamM_Alexandra]|uniref:Uncharacterized protein n=1 Tax=Erwinia phage vB_EamM_Alexandra TaxID=2201424 RepID=A0A2Z4QDW2_9CAUD|nr:hypothetical protein HOT49_gp192 [Erwinia phage vB_EamM_Alexandra]AWY08460.1 hypothetical protein Alexandra_194 [Erwinia phage vB_EamM_Alexandra]
MQYIAAPGNAFVVPTSPELFFFDAVQDRVDLDTAATSLTALETTLRDARTVLGNSKNTMITRGQKDSVYYLTELARNIGSTELLRLGSLIGPDAPYYGVHASWSYGMGVPNNNNRVITLVPSALQAARTGSMPMLGVRSGIPSSRTYTVTVTVRTMNTSLVLENSYSYGYYAPPSSPSGGTVAQGENNTFTIANNVTHFAWPAGVTISDTGYGPSVVYPNVEADVRGIRIKQQIKPSSEVFNLTDACLSFPKVLVRLKKGLDYVAPDDCQAGMSYQIDFTPSRQVFLL